MRELEQKAYSYLGRDPVLCMDMLEVLRRGGGSVYAVSEEGALIYERNSRAYMLAAENNEAGERLTLGMKKPLQLAVHDAGGPEYFCDLFQYEQTLECVAAAYLDPEPPYVSSRFALRALAVEDEEDILSALKGEFEENELERRLASGVMHGAYRGGELAGVVGLYPEGGVGMLAVRENEDYMKVGKALVGFITGWCLEKCFAPFAHIPAWDERQVELYRQVGYTMSEKTMFWLG